MLSKSAILKAASFSTRIPAELIEIEGRLQDKGIDPHDPEEFRREQRLMEENGDSVCAGITDDEDKHRAVAARYPRRYAMLVIA